MTLYFINVTFCVIIMTFYPKIITKNVMIDQFVYKKISTKYRELGKAKNKHKTSKQKHVLASFVHANHQKG